jgi:3-phenylpropionate/trans-cinnamate dioxygenase ferredoxin component
MERDRLTFVKVAETSEIPLGKMKVVEIAEKEVLITNVNGSYYAIENSCTHMHEDLSKGNLEGNTLTCPKHKAKFDVTTGKVVSGPKDSFDPPKNQR